MASTSDSLPEPQTDSPLYRLPNELTLQIMSLLSFHHLGSFILGAHRLLMVRGVLGRRSMRSVQNLLRVGNIDEIELVGFSGLPTEIIYLVTAHLSMQEKVNLFLARARPRRSPIQNQTSQRRTRWWEHWLVMACLWSLRHIWVSAAFADAT